MDDPSNEVIEPETDRVSRDMVEVNGDNSEVQNIKYVIKGLRLGLGKIVSLRMSRTQINDPQHQFLATRALDRAIDSLEEAICFLRRALVDISKNNPGMFPTEAPHVNKEQAAVEEETKSTDEIMESRAEDSTSEEDPELAPIPTPEPGTEEELDPYRPYTGEDYLPGGRLYKEPAIEEAVAEAPTEEELKKCECGKTLNEDGTCDGSHLNIESAPESGNESSPSSTESSTAGTPEEGKPEEEASDSSEESSETTDNEEEPS
jgi:CDGSH-type Zn-finger protein